MEPLWEAIKNCQHSLFRFEGLQDYSAEDGEEAVDYFIQTGQLKEIQDIHLEKGDLDREMKELESEAEMLAEKSAELTAKLRELLAVREADPTAAELADIEEDLNELGTLWNHIKTSTPFGLIATGIGTSTTIGVVEASAGNWQGWGWLVLAGAMIAKATPEFKQVIEDYRSKKTELESRRNELQANQTE